MSRPTWRELDTRRKALQTRMSRAEMARRAGVSESTITKGINNDAAPVKNTRLQVELVLDAAEKMAEAGL